MLNLKMCSPFLFSVKKSDNSNDMLDCRCSPLDTQNSLNIVVLEQSSDHQLTFYAKSTPAIFCREYPVIHPILPTHSRGRELLKRLHNEQIQVEHDGVIDIHNLMNFLKYKRSQTTANGLIQTRFQDIRDM